MGVRSKVLVGALLALAAGPSAFAQHLPSPGTSFDQLLLMTQEAAKAGDVERRARLALVACSRILARPDVGRQEALLRIFDDLTTGAARRAQAYVSSMEGSPDALAPLGSVAVAWRALGDPLAAQVDELLEVKYRESARFALEPLWALDPPRALEALARIDALPAAEAAVADGPLNTALRLGEAMSRGTGGAAIATMERSDARQKSIEELRRETALAMVDVARTALESGHPWLTLDLAEIAPTIFALHANRFAELRAAAWVALTGPRAEESKALVSARFKGGKRLLSNRAWIATADAVRFPVPSGKPGALVTTVPQQGDFRFAADFTSDFDACSPAVILGFKGAADFLTIAVTVADGAPGIRIRRHAEGTPRDVFSWDAEDAKVLADHVGVVPLVVERRSDQLWLRVGNAPWQNWSSRVVDFSGAIGFYVDGEATGKVRPEARNLELEALPR